MTNATTLQTGQCKGSWVLGTACGHCSKCKDEAIKLMPDLLKVNSTFSIVRRIAESTDGRSLDFKTSALAEIRRVVMDAKP